MTQSNGKNGSGSKFGPSLQNRSQVLPNPIGYDADAAKEIVDDFNTHVASSIVLYHQIKKHHWLVRGPQWKQIHLLLDEYADEILEQADFFAERITYFGGIPVAGLPVFEEVSFIKSEAPDMYDLKRMLANDIHATKETLVRLRASHEITDKHDDFYDESEIENFIGLREKFCHELHFLLEPDELAAETLDPHKEVLLADKAIAEIIGQP
jgi:starvation-inducible DNA-binding protein